MSLIKKINIKEDFPAVSTALAQLEIEIDCATFEGIKVLKVIHGYGSHGKGGDIKKAVHQRLQELVRKKKILDFCKGEQFSSQNVEVKKYFERYPELILDEDLKGLNAGISVIFLI